MGAATTAALSGSQQVFFHSWYDLLRVLVVGVCGYTALVLILRTTGKRTLSKMNAFDLIVTISLGSTLSALILSSDVALAEGLLALAVLCGLQYAVALASVHSARFRKLIKAEPTLLFFRGHYLPAMLKKERVAEEEVVAAVRQHGAADLRSVVAVVLETDGSFSVVTGSADAPTGALRFVPEWVENGPPGGEAKAGTAPGPT